jgi:hypothetical protein
MMNANQQSAIRRATNLLSQQYHQGRLSFTVQELGNDKLLFAATNIHGDLAWFQKTADFFAIVGPRGGIKKYEGNMSL